MKKQLLALFCATAMLLPLVGCGGGSGDAGGGVVDDLRTELQAQGRQHGETVNLQQDETMKTVFFNMKVNSVVLKDEVEDYVPDDPARKFLVVNATVTNTFEDDTKIPMFGNDFELTWEALNGDTILPESAFTDGQLPDEYEIFKNESRTGDIIFVVPGDITEFDVKYYELWDDDFEGNSYFLHVTPEAAPAAGDAAQSA